MAKKTVTIDQSQVDNLFEQLGPTQTQPMILKALKAGGKVLQTNTKTSLQSSVNHVNNKMIAGIKLSSDKAENLVTVSILGDYRLWILENGTGLRATDKGYNRGQITARHFFSQARNNSESSMTAAIMESLNSQFNRLTK